MSFDSEDSEINYIAEENDDSPLSTSQREYLNDDDRADLYADNSLANEEWTAKWGGCWQRTRTSSDGMTRRQWYVEVREW